MVNQIQTDDGQQKFVKANRKIWVFQGTNAKELLLTREAFVTIMEHLGVDKDKIIDQFTKCSNQDALAEWREFENEANPLLSDNWAGFDCGIQMIINVYALDTDTKRTIMDTMSEDKNGFRFQDDNPEADMMSFTRRVTTILCYIDQL